MVVFIFRGGVSEGEVGGGVTGGHGEGCEGMRVVGVEGEVMLEGVSRGRGRRVGESRS